MKEGGYRGLLYFTGSRWVSLALAALLIGILAVVLLAALEEEAGQAERMAVELTVRNMRTGLQLAMGEALMQGREREIAGWAGSNPLRWLQRPPAGYGGECLAGSFPEPGEWCFDSGRQELLYLPERVAAQGSEPGRPRRWQVRVVSAGGRGIGARVEEVTMAAR